MSSRQRKKLEEPPPNPSVKACGICIDAGGNFVKTAGGVRDSETLLAMYELGATRFGVGVRTAEAILAGGAESTRVLS